MKTWKSQYRVEATNVKNNPGTWDSQLVSIFKEDEKIGEYLRNYSSLYDTFHPFRQAAQHFALYSKDYTATRIMSLPDCKDLGGEEPDGFGFCPTGYAVPDLDEDVGLKGQFGFLCGCVWGDDTSWKIQFLDLSKAQDGVVTRDDRFGYIELLDELSLADAIDLNGYDGTEHEDFVRIACTQHFRLSGRDRE